MSPDGESIYQGAPNRFANPMLTLYPGSDFLAKNDDWGEDSTIKSYKHLRTLARFHWPQVAQNVAIFVSLGQGLYTVIPDGGLSDTGIALFEINVVDQQCPQWSGVGKLSAVRPGWRHSFIARHR